MDESAIRMLLAYTVSCMIAERTPGEQIADPDGFAQDVADACFDGLTVGLRQCFATEREFSIDEVGAFRLDNNEWKFYPAASLVEADASRLSPKGGTLRIARHAVFFLNQAIEMLRACQSDVALESAADLSGRKPPPEERLLMTMFGEGARARNNLSDQIQTVRTDLLLILRKLRFGTTDLASAQPEGSISDSTWKSEVAETLKHLQSPEVTASD